MDKFNKIIAPLSLDNIGSGVNTGVQAVGNVARGASNELGYLGNKAFKGIGNAMNGVKGAIGNAVPGRAMFQQQANQIKAYKKGGKVDKTGLAYLHKGEKVLTAAKTRALENKKK